MGKLFRNIRFFIYGLIVAALLFTFPAQAKFNCNKLSETMLLLMGRGYAALSVSDYGDKGASVGVMLDQHGNAVLLGIDANLNACVLMNLTNWTWMVVKEI